MSVRVCACWKKKMPPKQPDTYWVFMALCVNIYTDTIINTFAYSHAHSHAEASSLWQLRGQVCYPVMKSTCAPGDQTSSKLIFFWLTLSSFTQYISPLSFSVLSELVRRPNDCAQRVGAGVLIASPLSLFISISRPAARQMRTICASSNNVLNLNLKSLKITLKNLVPWWPLLFKL